MTFGSLFAGIGGMDLGLERAGMECRWQVEIDPYATRVLAKHWPHVRRWKNIKTFLPDTASERRRAWGPRRTAARRERRALSSWVAQWRVDLIAGGFPCQDISYAGRGAGLAGKRSGLWFEFARVVRTLRPRFVLVENVPALLTRGLDAVLGTLASLGYDAEWTCLPAAAVGAPHIRDRVFIVANAQRSERGARGSQGCRMEHAANGLQGKWKEDPGWPGVSGEEMADPNTDGRRLQGVEELHGQQWPGINGTHRDDALRLRDDGSDAQRDRLEGIFSRRPEARATLGSGRDWWATEPDVGRVAYGVPARVDRLRGLGNAVVPQVAEWIGQRIIEAANQEQTCNSSNTSSG